MTVDVNCLFEEIGNLLQVEAIALGGSRATGRNDEKSDYDVYVYITDSIPESERKNILGKYCKYMEIGNSFWELEDDVTLKDGIDMDIIYRNIKDFENMVSSVVFDCVSWNGYTTCMWHNLITSKIVLDKNCKLNALQALKSQGQELAEDRKLKLCLNNYRSTGTGGYPLYPQCPLVKDQPTEISQMIIEYIDHHKRVTVDKRQWLHVV